MRRRGQCRRAACTRLIDRVGLCTQHYMASQDRGYIDSTAVRRHITALNDAGHSYRAIAADAAMTPYGVQLILTGERVQKGTAQRILRIPTGGDGLVPAVGTRRRMQALAAIGWTYYELARRLGETPKHVSQFLQNERILADKARRVKALFDELSTTPGPSQASRARAQQRNWAPPLAWDDETIDDPNAQPQHNVHRPVRFADRYEELCEFGVTSVSDIADRLNTTPENVDRQIHRYRAAQRKALAS